MGLSTGSTDFFMKSPAAIILGDRWMSDDTTRFDRRTIGGTTPPAQLQIEREEKRSSRAIQALPRGR